MVLGNGPQTSVGWRLCLVWSKLLWGKRQRKWDEEEEEEEEEERLVSRTQYRTKG